MQAGAQFGQRRVRLLGKQHEQPGLAGFGREVFASALVR